MKEKFEHLLILFCSVIVLAVSSGCKEKQEADLNFKKTNEYEFERKMMVYDLGNNVTNEVEIYINKNKDTIVCQNFVYNNKVLDSTESLFYTLKIKKNSDTDEYDGLISYHFNPEREGKLASFDFTVISHKVKEKADFLSFDNYNIKNNSLEFKFKNRSDTVIGFMYAQHSKNIVENGEDKIQISEILLPVDNYPKTNNPFVEDLTLK
ncbi:hypothetical protein [Cochleicola gelatinilyticus]|uniref:Lipoprotein n=1 Tax=Cochleicola gelatinilyticus TaxID=1763537 RepID=A0A167KB53_9FLAO|nr:hypothetical protein [Cochleicola gelatinilyticus]OAB81681.1 hypothetical protein ULVI_00895 [Cochleicola gelatinilyticus]